MPTITGFRRGRLPGLSGLAQTYAKMGRNEEAKALVEKALAANPRSAEDLRLAGELLLLSDPKQSLTYFHRAESEQSNPRTELLMARAYQRVGDRDQAKKWLEAARSKAPHNPDVLRSVAAYYRETGQYQLALETLKPLPAKDANAMAELAFTYQMAGEKKQAAQMYMRAAAMGSSHEVADAAHQQRAADHAGRCRRCGAEKRAAALLHRRTAITGRSTIAAAGCASPFASNSSMPC